MTGITCLKRERGAQREAKKAAQTGQTAEISLATARALAHSVFVVCCLSYLVHIVFEHDELGWIEFAGRAHVLGG